MKHDADETLYRLGRWRKGSGASEQLAAQLLLASGFERVDPRHPHGGPDGGIDAIAWRDDQRWIVAVHFSRQARSFSAIRDKFRHDLAALYDVRAAGIVFVTNQELTLRRRSELVEIAKPAEADVYHLDRIATILDQPSMHPVRQQFLGLPSIDDDEWSGTYQAPPMPAGWPKVFRPSEDDEWIEDFLADPDNDDWKIPLACVCEFDLQDEDAQLLGWGDGREGLEGAIPEGLSYRDLQNPIVWHWLNLLWDAAEAAVGEGPSAFEAREDWFRDKRAIREFVQEMEAAQAEFDYFHPDDNELRWRKPWE